MLSGLINIIVLNICSLGLITPSSVCHLRTEFWLAVSFGDFSPIGWNDTKIFDPKDILVDPARMSLGYSGSHAGSTKKSLKCPRGMKKTRSYSNTHLRSLMETRTASLLWVIGSVHELHSHTESDNNSADLSGCRNTLMGPFLTWLPESGESWWHHARERERSQGKRVKRAALLPR